MICDQEMLSSSWTRIEYFIFEGYVKVPKFKKKKKALTSFHN